MLSPCLDDVLNENEDLLARAGEMLAALPKRALSAELAGTEITVTTKGISRLDAYVDRRPRRTLDVTDGETTFELGAEAGLASLLELQGYDGAELVAARRVSR
jgi:hypothetical protein